MSDFVKKNTISLSGRLTACSSCDKLPRATGTVAPARRPVGNEDCGDRGRETVFRQVAQSVNTHAVTTGGQHRPHNGHWHVKPESDDRSSIAVALGWAMQVMAISASTALPALVGYWLDQRFHSQVVFTVVGSGLGIALGGWQLARLVQVLNRQGSSKDDDTT